MALTPVEIRHIKLSRSLFGYNRSVVDELLDDIVESFEQVWRDERTSRTRSSASRRTSCAIASSRPAAHDARIRRARVSGSQGAGAARDPGHARRGHAESRRVRREATADLERMRSESRRIRSLLGAALATLEEDNGADESEAKAA